LTPPPGRSLALLVATLLAGALVLSSCAGSAHSSTNRISLPPAHGRFSYQIGGPYQAPSGVKIVDRDRSAPAAAGSYSICYVNAFQAQVDAVNWWKQHHPELLLRQKSGGLVIDKDWNEPLLDISTGTKRSVLSNIVGGWIDGCAASGYKAVEADNLDSYTRSGGLLSVDDALAFGRLITARAHHDRLAIAQKNAADLTTRAHPAGFDFAVAEECQVFSECDAYTAVYGSHVIEIEYTDNPRSAFTAACSLRGRVISVVLRDRDVSPSGDPHHVERWCP
jgi:hypothetical protein